MKLIVGLGNVGKEYENTRHNMGFLILDNYLNNVNWKNDKKAFFYKTIINNQDVIFIKPKTFMNLSGEAVKYYVDYYKINLKDILVIQDDMDLAFCSIRIKNNSGDGGHNGIKNIILNLNSNSFLRLKFGIAHPNNNDVIDYVLNKFTEPEMIEINKQLSTCNEIINDFILEESTESLMNKYN